MELKDSQTFINLQKAFDGELVVSSKYRIYGSKARSEGYQQIGDIFDETAHDDQEHARMWLKLMNNGEVPSTLENLENSVETPLFIEEDELTQTYQSYADTARKEGFTEIATLFDGVANIERDHNSRFRALIQNIVTDQVFCKKNEVVWICLNCGNLLWGKCAPERCPICFFPQGYYAIYCVDY